MASVGIREMLEAGVHLGHQTKRWNPKMEPYIFGARNGVYVVDLQKTVTLFQRAADFVQGVVNRGGNVLFVGTKRQAEDTIEEEARRCGQFWVTQRWLGGTLTNWSTISRSIRQLKRLEEMGDSEDRVAGLTKKERLTLEKKRQRMEKVLEGIKNMPGLPDAIFVIDPNKERIAVAEANKLNIPVIAITDTNCDPDPIQYVIPGNDDAIRSIRLFASRFAEAVVESRRSSGKTQEHEAKKAEKQAAARPKMEEPEASARPEVEAPEAAARPKMEEPAAEAAPGSPEEAGAEGEQQAGGEEIAGGSEENS